jgi:predicted dehydrogenase
MPRKTLKAGLVGAGQWGTHAHLPALLAQSDIDVVAVADPDIERARAAAAKGGSNGVYASAEELLAGEPLDLLIVAAPTEAHAPIVSGALRAGIAVLCEKPLTNTVEEGLALADLAEHARVPSSVGFSFRYAPPLQALKRDIAHGALGELWLLEMFEYNAQFHPSRGKPMNWKGDPALARAGALLEYGSHLIDLAAWLAGPIEEVHASLTRVLPGARLDDIATMQVRFGGPAIGVFVSGWVLSGSVPGIKIRVHGSEGLAEVEMNETLHGWQAYRRATLDGVMREVPLEPLTDPQAGYATRHIADLVARLRAEKTPFPDTLPTLRDGARVQQVIEAALASTGGWQRPADMGTSMRATASRAGGSEP